MCSLFTFLSSFTKRGASIYSVAHSALALIRRLHTSPEPALCLNAISFCQLHAGSGKHISQSRKLKREKKKT